MQRDHILEVVDDLTEEQFQRRFGPSVHSIAWQVWHCARWEDWLASKLPVLNPRLRQRIGTPKELWQVEGLAVKWAFPAGEMGSHDTGTKMPPDEADALAMPPKTSSFGTRAKRSRALIQFWSSCPRATSMS